MCSGNDGINLHTSKVSWNVNIVLKNLEVNGVYLNIPIVIIYSFIVIIISHLNI